MNLAKFITLLFVLPNFLIGQSSDPVLFKVAGNPIHVSEFEYIYNKNNGKDADFSKKSLEDYLNLYTKFKLKVQAARDMRLDTVPALIKELEGYRQQLTSNYLNDKEVTDRLAREVYERQKKDLLLSHILISLNNNPTPADTLKAFNQINDIYQKIKSGMAFSEAAKTYSNDVNSARTGGILGWFSAMMPDGFYALENAAYAISEQGSFSYSAPVRSRLGYHILKLEKERPARRKIEAAHILIKKKIKGYPDELAKRKADSLYTLIKAGNSFEEFARLHSDDKTSSHQGGNIGYFAINQYEQNFEDAAHALKANGDYSSPVETNIGYHIIKRLNKEDELPYDRAKRKIQADITRDSRFTLAQGTLIEKIKTEAKFNYNKEAFNRLVNLMDSNFFTYKWKVPDNLVKEKLCTLGKLDFSTDQFMDHVKSNTRMRLQGAEDNNVRNAMQNLFDDFISQKCLQYEEGRLEDKYPDFKSLMREYREGILLFEATKNVVWDKASEDTLGLKIFYDKNKSRYLWDERAVILSVTIDTNNTKIAEKIYNKHKGTSIDKLISKFDKKKSFLSFQKNIVEKKSTDSYVGLNFQKGFMSPLDKDKINENYHYRKIETILPSGQKSLDEARGYIIADYQEYLEGLWTDELKAKYKVELNESVFNSLIKK
ncbi:MAG: peptidylprolyl isomerase [Saprospiraceae bacterium]|nr:peptidylprolyl isomerase [Saprospiraceae bacterium]MBK7465731.1 peptidylprolyl isomerase [Saprospiraceae bacterium]MBK9993844.1 peptidylprolyl isomerase [Saprospiraceae bacterium]